jgi:hypothetical protein
MTLTSTTGMSHHGWNLLGNPYQSALRWNDGNWALGINIQAIAKALNPGGTYTDLLPGSIIPAANGFFVWTADATGNTLTIPLASRVHDFTPWYKSVDVQDNRLKLTAASGDNNTYVETIVGFDQASTAEYDLNYDSHFFKGIVDAPEMYSMTPSQADMSTNIMPAVPQTNTIHVNFVKGTSATYTITADGIGSFAQGATIMLEDLKAGITQDLRANAVYNFTSVTGDNKDRFLLHFGGIFGVQEQTAGMVSAYSWEKSIYVINNSGKTLQSVVVYDLLGRELVKKTQVDSKLLKIDMPYAQTGYYMIRVITDQKPYSKKLFLN